MSEKKFEECSLGDATHIEVNGKMYKLGGNEVVKEYFHFNCIGLRWYEEDTFIPEQLFSTLGIKTFKEIKPEPIEFVGFTKYVSRTLSHIINVPLGTPPQTRFKCVEILEDED